MTGKQTIAKAKEIAEANQYKKEYYKGDDKVKIGDTHNMVRASKVIVTMPNEGVYHDFSDDELENLKVIALDKNLSVHEFDIPEEPKAKEPKAKEPKAKN